MKQQLNQAHHTDDPDIEKSADMAKADNHNMDKFLPGTPVFFPKHHPTDYVLRRIS